MLMNDGSPEIPWNLLPNKPREFFELDEDFTRRDLKRSYNRYLKMFKPEKYPEEFKKIRAAYELLEENLAYGTPLPQGLIDTSFESTDEQTDWEVLIQEQKTEPSRKKKQGAENIEPEQRTDDSCADNDDGYEVIIQEQKTSINTENLCETDPFAEELLKNIDKETEPSFQETKNNPVKLKSSEDIISLINNDDLQLPEKYLYGAFIKESEDGEESFLKFLLEGHKLFPDDYRLNYALEKYCRSKEKELSADRILTLLDDALSKKFFQISEPVWIAFFKEHGFEGFTKKLKECKNSRSYNDPNELTIFNVRLCRRFFFRMDLVYVKDKIHDAEEYYEGLSYDIQSDIDFVLNLIEYHLIKEDFRHHKHQYCRHLHDLLVDWCELESTEATKKALSFLSQHQHMKSLESFKINDDKYDAFWSLFSSIITDLEYEVDWSNNQYDDEEKEMKVREFLLVLEKKTEQSFMGTMFPFTYILFFGVHLAIILLPAIIIGLNNWHPENVVAEWAAYIGLSLVSVYCYWKTIERFPILLMDFITEWPKNRVYEKIWRYEVAEFIKDSGITCHELEWTSTYMENKSGIAYDSDLRECMERDMGIRIYSAGMQFQ